MKKWLHKHFGWFHCVENYWCKVVELEDVVIIDKEKESGHCKIIRQCEVCKDKQMEFVTFCKHTKFEVGDVFEYACMGRMCYC